MSSFLSALFLVVVAEMGDKTQLLAMAMASKYKAKHVLMGVFIATVLNHGLAVGIGSYLSSLIPMTTVQIVAAISFLIFGLWTIRGDQYDDDKKKKSKFGPILTVTIAFFFAEMGDKTQLMTISIAANHNTTPLLILAGTTAGMLVADSIGILGGAWMCKHVSEKLLKWIPGVIFMIFGTITLANSVPRNIITPVSVITYTLIMALSIYIIGFYLARQESDGSVMNTCPFHHVLPAGKCAYFTPKAGEECPYNSATTTDPCPYLIAN